MVFSSLPYMDPAANWNQQHGADEQQQQQQQQQDGTNITNTDSFHFISQPQLHLQQPPQQGGQSLHLTTANGTPSYGPSSIRPGSMVDRARLARLPLPEPGLKCPRCESTNTKFCYFNNYSLSQPRHFCKACRRYWTRGGALRTVPVGGGCRRNKRSKSTGGGGRSKSPMSLPKRANTTGGGGGGGINNNDSNNTTGLKDLNHFPNNLLPPSTQLPSFFPTLQNLNDYVTTGDFGLNMGSFSAPPLAGRGDMGFQMGLGSSSGPISRVHQQFPFLAGLDSSPSGGGGGGGLFNFPRHSDQQGSVHVMGSNNGLQAKYMSEDIGPQPTVKREDPNNQLGLVGTTPKNLLGIQVNDDEAGNNNALDHGHDDDQYSNWQNAAAAGNEWSTPDLSVLNNSSSSTGHLM